MSTTMILWTPSKPLAEINKEAIKLALKHFRGNKTATAQSLGISIRTLDQRLDEYRQQELDEAFHDKQERERRAEHIARARGTGADVVPGPRDLTPKPTGLRDSFLPPLKPQASGAQLGLAPEAGAGTQPATATSAELAVPVPEQSEVQEVLRAQPAAGRNKRASAASS